MLLLVRKLNFVFLALTKTSRTDIFDFSTNTWRSGPELPALLAFGATVPFGETFLVTGGETLASIEDTIYEYDGLNEAWILRQERLPIFRKDHSALIVSADYLGCAET